MPDGTYALLDLPCCWFESTPLSLPQKKFEKFQNILGRLNVLNS